MEQELPLIPGEGDVAFPWGIGDELAASQRERAREAHIDTMAGNAGGHVYRDFETSRTPVTRHFEAHKAVEPTIRVSETVGSSLEVLAAARGRASLRAAFRS